MGDTKTESAPAGPAAGSELRTGLDPFWIGPPEGAWGYEVDDLNLVYAPPESRLLFASADGVAPIEYRHGRVETWNWARLAPNTEYRAWGNQYVSLYEYWSRGGYGITLHLRLTVRGHVITRVRVEVPDGRWERWHLAPRVLLPEAPRTELEMKMACLARWYTQARAEQEGGVELLTAHDRYVTRQAKRKKVTSSCTVRRSGGD